MTWAARPASPAAVSLLSAGVICLHVSSALSAFSQLCLYAAAAHVFSVGSSQEEGFEEQMLMEERHSLLHFLFLSFN